MARTAVSFPPHNLVTMAKAVRQMTLGMTFGFFSGPVLLADLARKKVLVPGGLDVAGAGVGFDSVDEGGGVGG